MLGECEESSMIRKTVTLQLRDIDAMPWIRETMELGIDEK
jgi:hypothetical protein